MVTGVGAMAGAGSLQYQAVGGVEGMNGNNAL